MNIQELYASVTANIIAELERGAVPWVKDWKGGSILPRNAITKSHYNGINIPILWYSAEKKGYEHHQWCTFKQSCNAGYHIRKGEKATHIVYTSSYRKEVDSEDVTAKFLKTYSVFNIAQIENFPMPVQPKLTIIERNAKAEELITSTGATIHYGGNEACYIPSLDIIKLPKPEAFNQAASFYSTAFHELTHWAGEKKRCDRDLQGRFGDKKYAAEELVAELGAAFLCAAIGIQGELRHAGYIDHWLELLRDDDRAIFTASSKATQAANFIYPHQEENNHDTSLTERTPSEAP